MSRTGRPRSERASQAHIIRIKLRLYLGEDDDLIAFFEDIPSGLRAISVKQALRSGVQVADSQEHGSDDALLDLLDAFIL